jgi:hypothetical protein
MIHDEEPPTAVAGANGLVASGPVVGNGHAIPSAPTAPIGDGTAPATTHPLPDHQRSLLDRVNAHRRVIISWSILVVAFVLYTILLGLPYGEDGILLWLTAALFVASLGDLKRWRTGVIRDWLPFYLVLAAYGFLRGYASHVLWGPFVRPQVAFDKFIGGGTAPTVTLQRWLFNPDNLHVWDYLAWFTYMSHFFTTFIVLAVLWKRDHPRFRRYMLLFVSLTFIGYLTYVLYPAMPPWLASETGHLPSTTRIIPLVWNNVGIHQAAAPFSGNSAFDNNIAAMPSLHAAYPMLLLVFFWGKARPLVRVILVSYVLAMAFTLVYTGEHFVIDEFVGWSYAIITFVVGSYLIDRWTARRQHLWLIGPLPDPQPDTEALVPLKG